MTKRCKLHFLLFLCLPFISNAARAAGPTTAPVDRPGWKLSWSDEFSGTEIDRTKWDYDLGSGFYVPPTDGKPGTWADGWGNNELEYYTDRHKNAYVKDGSLHIAALKEDYKGKHYTSARLRSGGKGETALFTQKYGRFDFRAKLPLGQGLWPALWLLPQEENFGGWAASGEIDILEARGKVPGIVQGTLHYGGSYPANVYHGQQYRLPDNGKIDDFHVYALEWEPGEIRMSVDDKTYLTRNFWFSKEKKTGAINPWPAPFDRPFYILMNVAVGGQFGGDPDATSIFPQEMVVDYVRVYEKVEGAGKVKPIGAGDVKDPPVVKKPGE